MAVIIEPDVIIECAKKAANTTPGIYPIDEKTAQDWANQFAASPHNHPKKGRRTDVKTRFEERLTSLLRRAPEPAPEPTPDPIKILPETEAVENRPFSKGRLHTVVSPRDRFLGPWTKEIFLTTGRPGETLADLVERITPGILRGNCVLTDIGGNPIPLRRTTRRKIKKSASQGHAL